MPTVTVTPPLPTDVTPVVPTRESAITNPTDTSGIQPNIVHIFIDDPMLEMMDFMESRQDWGTATPLYPQVPFLNFLLDRGVLCVDHYVNTVCSTSRASLLTGLYPYHTGVGTVIDPTKVGLVEEFNIQANFNGFDTTPSLLTAAGYSTCIVGKSHLALRTTDTPAGSGFPHIKSESPVSPPNGVRFGDARITFRNLVGEDNGYFDYEFWKNGVLTNETEYATSKQVTEAIDFVNNATEPFYLYLPTNDTHDPLELPPPGLARSAEFDPPPVQGVWPNYSAKIEALDRELQRFYDSLTVQVRDRTIFFVSADNGSSDDVLANARDGFGQPIGATYDFLSNDARRRWKQFAYEGGGRSWCIISGKQVQGPGRTTNVLTHITDFLPTFLDIAQVAHPSGLVGYSMNPIIKNDVVDVNTWPRQQVMFSNWSPNGNWELITGTESLTNFLRRGFSSRTNVPGRWKLIKDLVQPDLLFQIEDENGAFVDPFEKNPVDFSTGIGATVKATLDTQLTAELAR